MYVFIYDTPSNDSRTAISEYNYILVLKNGTQLNLSEINEDFYISISVPIRNLDLANFDFAEKFYQYGFDIYNKSSDFYNDICTPAFINDNDITLNDRKEDIYPNNVTLCKENCVYKNVDIENKRIVCECNLNSNYEKKNENNSFQESEDNFITYFLDNINYKIFKCYHLLLSFDNLITNPAFYTIIIVLVINMFFKIKFCYCGIANLRIVMYKEIPTEKKLKELIKKKLKENKNKKDIKKNDVVPKRKICSNITDESNSISIIKKNIDKKEKIIKESKSNGIIIFKRKLSRKTTKEIIKTIPIHNHKHKTSKLNDFSAKIHKNILTKIHKTRINEKNAIKEDLDPDIYNLSPYTKALREDKRNIFQIIKSFIFEKIELLNLYISSGTFKEIQICQYILSLLVDFFFNTLLYSDEVVSNKYHNNGKLDFAVILVISSLSNILTGIILYYIKFSEYFEQKYDDICLIKYEKQYLYAFGKFLKYIKLGMIAFIIIELIIIFFSFYFIIIFFIVYSKSRASLVYNYLSSLLEGLIKSLIVISIIVLTRIIGINCKNVYLFNISKYIDKNF